jgi:hypothetical protein
MVTVLDELDKYMTDHINQNFRFNAFNKIN